jgi:hypothetical protein
MVRAQHHGLRERTAFTMKRTVVSIVAITITERK